jgi:parallel beta-helix repeat protein
MKKNPILVKRTLVIGTLILFFGLCINSSIGSIVEKEPTNPLKNGNTLYVGGSGPGNYSTIQEAIDAASDGDTIFIYSGIYHPESNIHIYKELCIVGEDKENVIFEREYGSQSLSIRAKNVEIRSITFKNFEVTNQVQYDNTIISNNIFIINNNAGHWNPWIMLIAGENNEISNNIFTSTNPGSKRGPFTVIFFQSYESKLINNIIDGFKSGITAVDILDYSYYVDDYPRGNNTIEGNTFSNNSCGIDLTPSLYPKFRSKIINNNFIDNEKNAIFYARIPSIMDIIKNFILKLKSPSENYKLFDLTNKYWDGNYWDDYDGDGPKKISGRIQTAGLFNQFLLYDFPWVNYDLHPAKEPYDI